MQKGQINQPISKKKPIRFSSSPGSLLLIIATMIFVSELFVMIVLGYMPSLTPYQEALIDAALLTIIIFPTLYFLVFRPMTDHIAERQRAEEGKDDLITKLNRALAEVKTLRGIIPICSHCKHIRDDKGYWRRVESYVHEHSEAEFSHGICPECADKFYPDMDLYPKENGS